ncbi:MAG: 4-(cytidine 5'-diphospho)-2-C-methyl-D-erythritol kinase [Gemmataceae bacterium]|nr:4-(cytidine 5'-diphospho)-2-C-methyl-D-erythritol kinase [Gemmata sp.]MDW8198731.1 4-(cytidine 5'-diphospho)-2-C-methyl-D-erythritol kinase [Gemmataceae bacterium]
MTLSRTISRFAELFPAPLAFPAGPSGLVLAAPAKLNLFLEIRRRRPDGYHDLESLMVAIDLFDTLEFHATTTAELTVQCDCPALSVGVENLVWRAAHALRQGVNRPDLGASIRLSKRIPMQAGLGGGSSDAATTLVGLNALWKLGLTRRELLAMAASIGSDVAFFLTLPAAWCTGRGEVVTEEASTGQFHFVLVCPPVGLGTAEVYQRLVVPAEPISGAAVRAAFRAGDSESLGRVIFNRLEEPAFALQPLVERIRRRLDRLGSLGVQMSGSGSAVFALCRDATHAAQVAARFRATCPADEPPSRVLVVRSLTP